VPLYAKEDLCIPIKSTSLVEAFYNIMLIASSYTALIIPGINENWCRFMQRRTFAYLYGVQMSSSAPASQRLFRIVSLNNLRNKAKTGAT